MSNTLLERIPVRLSRLRTGMQAGMDGNSRCNDIHQPARLVIMYNSFLTYNTLIIRFFYI